MTFNITEMLRRGRELDREEYEREAATKLGTLRAGNSGIMSDTGDIAASCHRKTLLRMLGLEVDPPDDSKQIMFQLGYASEKLAISDLRKPLKEKHPDCIILQESDFPISWRTKNDKEVTGRPDIVICEVTDPSVIAWMSGMISNGIDALASLFGQKARRIIQTALHDIADPLIGVLCGDKLKPVQGLELKSVHSVWTARDVLMQQSPKLANLAQAAHYMWKLGIPYKLIYKSYSSLGQGMSWSTYSKIPGKKNMADLFPRYGEPGSEFLDFKQAKDGTQIPQAVKQFEMVFDLELDKFGRVKFRKENTDKWMHSLVTIGDIERYYEFVSKMETEKDLGPRPMTVDLYGTKESYDMCDQKYCPLAATCDKFEGKGFEAWLCEARKLASTGGTKK